MIRLRLRQMESLVNHLQRVGRSRPAPPPRRLQTAQDVIELLQEQVETLRSETWLGTVERARAIGYLAGIARKAIETGALAARIEMLEAVLKRRRTTPRQ